MVTCDGHYFPPVIYESPTHPFVYEVARRILDNPFSFNRLVAPGWLIDEIYTRVRPIDGVKHIYSPWTPPRNYLVFPI